MEVVLYCYCICLVLRYYCTDIVLSILPNSGAASHPSMAMLNAVTWLKALNHVVSSFSTHLITAKQRFHGTQKTYISISVDEVLVT